MLSLLDKFVNCTRFRCTQTRASSGAGLEAYTDHYNGNIKATTWNKGSFEKPIAAPQNVTVNATIIGSTIVEARNSITLASGFEVTGGNTLIAGIDSYAMTQPMELKLRHKVYF